MSRKRTNRKVYALIDTLRHAMVGAAITDTASLDKLRLLELSALESFRLGKATREDWKALADLLNIAQTMAESGIGPEVLPVCARAEEALGAAHARFKAGGSLAFDGPGLQALRELAEYHDAQRTSVSRSAYENAIRKTAARIKSAHASLKVMV